MAQAREHLLDTYYSNDTAGSLTYHWMALALTRLHATHTLQRSATASTLGLCLAQARATLPRRAPLTSTARSLLARRR